MKLSSLNTAIRKSTDHVRIWFRIPGCNAPLLVAVQKSSLIEALRVAYEDKEKWYDTGLELREQDNLLVHRDLSPDPEYDDQWNRQVDALIKIMDEDDDLLSDDPIATVAEDIEDLLA